MNLIDFFQSDILFSIAPVVLAAIISGAAAAGSSVASGVSAKRQQRRQNQMNQEQAKYQNTLNLEQWNRENEYNTPSAQMQRLIDAGVNPRLAWNNSNNTSAPSPTLSAPEQQYTAVGGEIGRGLSDAFGSAINTVNQMNQIRKTEEEMKLIQAQIGYYGSMTHLNDVNANLRHTESLMKNISLNYHDLSERQRVYGKQLAMNNMLASYLNNYGAQTLTPNEHGLLSVDPSTFHETPMTTLNRRQIAAQIALADAKAVESVWSAKAKQKGIAWLGQRMYSEKLKQNVMDLTSGLLRHKKLTELTKQNLLNTQGELMRTQMGFIKAQTERQNLLNANYFPGIGDISSYFHFASPSLWR